MSETMTLETDMPHQAQTRSANARLKRRMATIAARCAMGSWIVLAAMPVAVVVFSIA